MILKQPIPKIKSLTFTTQNSLFPSPMKMMTPVFQALIFSVLFLNGINGFTQFQFDAGTFTPHATDSYTVGRCVVTNEGGSGTNQSWDFSVLDALSSSTYEVVNATEVICNASYPEANLAIGNDGSYEMLTTDDYNVMSYGSTITPGMAGFHYADPKRRMGFPMNMNDTWTDDFNGTSPDDVTRTGTTTMTYDGYGTLITPFGTYYGVNRMHEHTTYTDVSSDGSCSAVLDYYYWYSVDYRYPLARIWSGTGTCGLTAGSEFLSDIQASVSNNEAQADLSVYPNPFSNQLIVRNTHGNSAITTILSDVNGLEIQRNTVGANQQINMETPALPTGMYVLTILQKGEVVSRKKVMHLAE